MNKKDLIIKMKSELKWVAIPRNINSRPKAELEKTYNEAITLGLIK